MGALRAGGEGGDVERPRLRSHLVRRKDVPAGDAERGLLLERERRDVLRRLDRHAELGRDGARREVEVRELVEANEERVQHRVRLALRGARRVVFRVVPGRLLEVRGLVIGPEPAGRALLQQVVAGDRAVRPVVVLAAAAALGGRALDLVRDDVVPILVLDAISDDVLQGRRELDVDLGLRAPRGIEIEHRINQRILRSVGRFDLARHLPRLGRERRLFQLSHLCGTGGRG